MKSLYIEIMYGKLCWEMRNFCRNLVPDFLGIPWKLICREKIFIYYFIISVIANSGLVFFVVNQIDFSTVGSTKSLYISSFSVLSLIFTNCIVVASMKKHLQKDDPFFGKKMICALLSFIMLSTVLCLVNNCSMFFIQVFVSLLVFILDFIFFLYSQMENFPDFVKYYCDSSYQEMENEDISNVKDGLSEILSRDRNGNKL